MVRPERLELPTLCSEGRCSIQLSYGRGQKVFYGKMMIRKRAKRARSVAFALSGQAPMYARLAQIEKKINQKK